MMSRSPENGDELQRHLDRSNFGTGVMLFIAISDIVSILVGMIINSYQDIVAPYWGVIIAVTCIAYYLITFFIALKQTHHVEPIGYILFLIPTALFVFNITWQFLHLLSLNIDTPYIRTLFTRAELLTYPIVTALLILAETVLYFAGYWIVRGIGKALFYRP